MGLLDAIPGLAAHQEDLVESAEFDRPRADRLIRDAYSFVSSMYPAGALEWLGQHRPDVTGYLKECEAAVDAAVLTGDQEKFEKSLEVWSAAHRKAFFIYLERPPVIQRDVATPAEAA